MGERPGELEYDAAYDALNEPAPGLGVPPDYVAGGAPGAVGYYGTTDTRATAPGDMLAGRTNTGVGDTGTEDQDPTALRHDIERTRQHMSSTIDAIQEKLSPQHMVQEAKDAAYDATIGRAGQVMNDVSDTVQSAGSTLLDTIRENPIPAALAALGLGWLAVKVYNNAQSQNGYNYRGYGPYGQGYEGRGGNGLNRYSTRYGGYGAYGTNYGTNQSAMSRAANTMQDAAGDVTDKVQDVAGNVADTMQDAASNVADTAQQWASQAQDQAQEWADDAQWQMQRARGWLERTWESNPIAVGVAALAAGAIIGGLIPETPMEDRMMGEARDNLLQKAEDVAQTGVQKAQTAAEQALHTVKQDVVQGQPQPSGAPSKAPNQPSAQAKSASAGTQPGSMSSGSTSSKGASSTTPTTGSQKQTPPPTTETSGQTQTTTP